MYLNGASTSYPVPEFRLTLTWDVFKSDNLNREATQTIWLTLTWDVFKSSLPPFWSC